MCALQPEDISPCSHPRTRGDVLWADGIRGQGVLAQIGLGPTAALREPGPSFLSRSGLDDFMVRAAHKREVRKVVRRSARANGNQMVNLKPSVAVPLAGELAAAVAPTHEGAHLLPFL
jgi:hypothetical protein